MTRENMLEQESLIGRRVSLRPFRKDNLPFVQKWYDDPETRKLVGEVAPMSRSEAEEFFRQLCADETRKWFAVVLKRGNRVIGEAGLLRMFRPWRCTDMTILVGEKDAWGKGYGTDAGHLLLDYAFVHLGFHKVSIGVVGFNERALRFWRSLGFKKEGVQRDGYYGDNEFSDFVMNSILEDEFRELRSGKAR
jgi:RimJ/RimL family protein N-acetyltransferase